MSYVVVEKGNVDFDIDACEEFRTWEEANHHKEKLKQQFHNKEYVIWQID